MAVESCVETLLSVKATGSSHEVKHFHTCSGFESFIVVRLNDVAREMDAPDMRPLFTSSKLKTPCNA